VAQVGVPLVEVLRLPGFSFDDLPPEPPDHEVAESHQSRLGKGLSAIMPSADAVPERRRGGGVASIIPLGPDAEGLEAGHDAPVDPSDATEVIADSSTAPPTRVKAPDAPVVVEAPATLSPTATRLVQRLHGDLVTALLDGLAVAAGGPDLVAYVHHADRGAPHLHLGRPALSELTPDRCFDLCRSLDARGRSRPGIVEPFTAGGFEGVAVVVTGTGARGLWVAARRGRPLDPSDADEAAAYARGTGAAATLLDLLASDAPTVAPQVQVRVEEGQVLAQVVLRGGQASVGAPTGVEAAARATLEAAGSDAEFLYAAAARDDSTAASVVLVRDGTRVGVGCAAGAEEAPALTATAALRAAGLDLAAP